MLPSGGSHRIQRVPAARVGPHSETAGGRLPQVLLVGNPVQTAPDKRRPAELEVALHPRPNGRFGHSSIVRCRVIGLRWIRELRGQQVPPPALAREADLSKAVLTTPWS